MQFIPLDNKTNKKHSESRLICYFIDCTYIRGWLKLKVFSTPSCLLRSTIRSIDIHFNFPNSHKNKKVMVYFDRPCWITPNSPFLSSPCLITLHKYIVVHLLHSTFFTNTRSRDVTHRSVVIIEIPCYIKLSDISNCMRMQIILIL